MSASHQPDPRPFAAALIVEDHPLFSEALSMTLRTFVGIERIETADSLATALTRLKVPPAPDVILLDLHLPDVTGMDGLIRLHQAAEGIPIMVVSSLADARVISAAMKAGAAGFVPKHSQRDVFRAAFDAVRSGNRYTPDGYQPGASDTGPTPQQDVIARLRLLTRQQAVILQLICEGKLNKQIAYDLSVAETTVKAHVTAIMRKLGVYSRTQAVLLASGVNFSALLSETGGSS